MGHGLSSSSFQWSLLHMALIFRKLRRMRRRVALFNQSISNNTYSHWVITDLTRTVRPWFQRS